MVLEVAGLAEMVQPSGSVQRCTLRWPRPVLAGSIRSWLVGWRFQACRPRTAGVGQDRPDRAKRPCVPRAVSIATGVRRPQSACALFGCGLAAASRYPNGGLPPR
jgi:hypothetical protein